MLAKLGSTLSPNLYLIALASILLVATGCSKTESAGTEQKRSTTEDVVSSETAVVSSHNVAQSDETVVVPVRKSNGCNTPAEVGGVHKIAMEHGGWERNSLMAVPESTADQPSAYPLLIVMHGFGGSGAGMRGAIGRHNGIETGRIVLYPDGAGSGDGPRGWNSGHPKCCGPALENNVDDVAFIRELVNAVAQKTCVDLNRVYATGFSNGGDMAQRLACDASDVVAAVTSVAGRFDYHANSCKGERPVPTVLFRGEKDRTVPYKSSLFDLIAIKTIPAIEGFERIARNHECTDKPEQVWSEGDTSCLRYSHCEPGYEVSLCTSAGAAHCWPGSRNCQAGAASFSASDYMQEFFARHTLIP